VTRNVREVGLPPGDEPSPTLAIPASVMTNDDYGRTVSRRVSEARRDQAARGLRSGGRSPYGTTADGRGGLRPGAPDEVAVVREVFEQFANESRSLRSIADDLNKRQVAAPRGGAWHAVTTTSANWSFTSPTRSIGG